MPSVHYCLNVPNHSPYFTIISKQGVLRVGRKKPDKQEEKIERLHLTFTEAQEFLGISHQTIYKLMKEGAPSHKMGKKRVFLKEDLIKRIKEH